MGALHLPGSQRAAVWAVRIAFSAVFAMNVTCALQFIVVPEAYVGAYGLSGLEGAVALRGLGVAFLMWNATYPAFVVSPERFSVLGWVILAQQAIGLGGEAAILLTLPSGMEALGGSIARFIAFDAAGLVVMGIAFAWFLMAARLRIAGK